MSAMSRATLYVIPGSHPAVAARRMLEHKGIEYKRIDLMPVISRGVLKALRTQKMDHLIEARAFRDAVVREIKTRIAARAT